MPDIGLVAHPFDQKLFAFWAVSVFSGMARDIPDVNKLQARLKADLSGLFQSFIGGGRKVAVF
jgi:hypothetical protein